MPLPYCTPEDISRKLDRPPDRITDARRQRYETRAAAASQRWDEQTGTPMRSVRVGAPGAPETYAVHDAPGRRSPLVISLDNDNIQPIDSSTGDTIELRTSRDSYEDITDSVGDEWVIDYRRGQLKLFRFLVGRAFFEAPDERFVRLTYRHGALGGSRQRGAETTLDGSVTAGDTTLSVTDAARLPQTPLVVALGTTRSYEYARVTDIDRNTDTLTVSRGVNQTDASDHSDGATVQYCPADVREAVAAAAVILPTLDDDAGTAVSDDGQLTSRTARADELRVEWEAAAASYSSVQTL